MFKQHTRKRKHSKTRVKAIVAARVAAAKTLRKTSQNPPKTPV
jgi:hypothetical protein